MFYPEELVEEIRQKNDIVDVISGYVQLKKQGGNYFGLCPFHNEKSPSFSVSSHKQMYYCFGCGAGGNVVTFVREYENYTFPEAIRFLAERVNVQLPEVEYTDEMRKRESRRSKLLEINKEAAKYFFYQLRGKAGELGKRYLTDRKLSEETMKKFGLGYALQYSDDCVKYLKKQGFTDEIIKDSGLALFKEKYGMSDKFTNRVMFPIQDINHRVIGFGGRVMGDAKPKYLNSPETEIFDKSRNLYGLNFARTSRKSYMILCEGYMDVIAMHQAGFCEAVASLGTSFTSGQAMLLKRYTKDVYLAYDSDGAGIKAALRAIGILREVGMSGRIINMEPYKDPDEFIKNLGTEEFQKRIDHAENSFLFEIRILQKDYDLSDPEQKTRFHTEIARKLCLFEEEMERENYLEAVSRNYQISPDSMRKMVISLASKVGLVEQHTPPKSGIQKKNTVEDGTKRAQRFLLTWLVEEPKLYSKIEKYITKEDFTDALYQQIADKLFEDFKTDNVHPAAIINMFEDVEEQRLAAEVFNTKLEAIDTRDEKEKAFHDIIVSVKKNSFAYYSSMLGTDVSAINQVIAGKKALEELEKTHISLD
ncbi:MAG TPA: DNA primase [Lachnospiraceae bacterium]|nr:DNA primase [Lachnospiraceae bacterium]